MAKKNLNGKQIPITWHVDNLKISHARSSKVTRMITKIDSQYGKMRISRGKVHNFLVMDPD